MIITTGNRFSRHQRSLITRPLAKVDFRPLAPQFWGNMSSKSPKLGGFRGHFRIYARGLLTTVGCNQISTLAVLERPDLKTLCLIYCSYRGSQRRAYYFMLESSLIEPNWATISVQCCTVFDTPLALIRGDSSFIESTCLKLLAVL
jgi:hypothetical protein